MTNQASLLNGDIDGSSRSDFSKLKFEMENRRKRKSQLISYPQSEAHTENRIESDESPSRSGKSMKMMNESSNLHFLTKHLQPYRWPWKEQKMNGKNLRDGRKTKVTIEEIEEGEITETKPKGKPNSYNNLKGWSGRHHRLTETSEEPKGKKSATISNETGHILIGEGHHTDQKGFFEPEETSSQELLTGEIFEDADMRMADRKATVKDVFMQQRPSSILKEDESLKDELVKILTDLKTQMKSSNYKNTTLTRTQMKRLIELEDSMNQIEWDSTWTKVRSIQGEGKSRCWEKSIKAQVDQYRLIEGWKVMKSNSTQDLKECMKLLQVEESWPVFSEIKYETFRKTMKLIKKISSENNEGDYDKLCKLIPPKILEVRLSRMSYMTKRSEIISHLYSDEELKSKQERGHDILLMLMIEEALYLATQIELELHPPEKDKKVWDVFTRLFRLMQGRDVIDDHNISSQRYQTPHWTSSMDVESFTTGSTPQSHRFKDAFKIILKNLEELQNIYIEPKNSNQFSNTINTLGNWSLSNILLGSCYGVKLITFKTFEHLANSNHHSYIYKLSEFETKKIKTPQVDALKKFLKARMELHKEGILSSYKPLKLLRLIQN
ncbi:hypothetical protein DFH28DRAFT_1054896 [Melampsora americana]|nr:hypothetical protein DFH28DRAFT_1054896 [Melampsora americana]